MTRQMKLGAFFNLPGHHVASWRDPLSQPDRQFDLSYLIELAREAERGKFDMIFFADVVGQPLNEKAQSGLKLDPLIILAALTGATRKIGLTATLTTTYNEPFHVARKFSAIDHLSNGRAAWNVVTSANEKEALLFGKEKHLQHKLRYERAEEFVDVVKQLWRSVEREALVLNKESGQFLDVTKTNPVHHAGKHFTVKGTLDAPASVQGHPVIVQAGSSESGKELAAKTAEVIFTAWQTIGEAQAFYRDVKGRLSRYGRNADDLKIMPGAFITVAETEAEAIEKRAALNSLIPPDVGLAYLSYFLGTDVSGYDLDAPIPDKVISEDPTNPQIRAAIVRRIATRENLTSLRQLYEAIAGGRGHWELTGTPAQIADRLQEWFENEAADGFNLMAPTFPQGLTDIVDLLIPELQRRGLFRTEYESSTLRGNLGLAIPQLHNKASVIR